MSNRISLEPFISEVMKKRLTMRSVLVYQEGREEVSFYWENYCSCRWSRNIYSASKTIAALGFGAAVEEGILSLDDKPIDFFPDEIEGTPSAFLEELTLRHLLTMSAGYEHKTPSMGWGSFERDQIPNWIKNAMNIPIVEKPGSKFHYNNVAPYVASAMLSKKTGQRLVDFMKPRFFDRLGILNPQWLTSPEGYDVCAGSLIITPEQMMKIGKLFLQEGVWEGQRLVSAEWIKEATKVQIPHIKPQLPPHMPPLSNSPGTEDYWSGYGYWTWINHGGLGYRAIGNGGQLILVLPEERAVVVTTADEGQSQMAFMDTIWDSIYPQLKL